MSDMREAFDKYYASLDDDLLPYHTMLETWQAAQSVPGFVLVPVEPTDEFHDLMYDYIKEHEIRNRDGDSFIAFDDLDFDEIYKRMLEKAQEKKNAE